MTKIETLQVIVPIVCWFVFSGTLNFIFWLKSPEQWIAFAERSPRLAALVKLVRAMGLNPVFALDALRQFAERKTHAGVPPWSKHRSDPPPPLPEGHGPDGTQRSATLPASDLPDTDPQTPSARRSRP